MRASKTMLLLATLTALSFGSEASPRAEIRIVSVDGRAVREGEVSVERIGTILGSLSSVKGNDAPLGAQLAPQ